MRTNAAGPAAGPPDALPWEGGCFSEYLQRYAANPVFADSEEWLLPENPYRRPIRPKVLRHLDFGKPLRRDELLSYSALAANRMLLNIYEADLLFLPDTKLAEIYPDFLHFYADETRALGEIVRPTLERHVFGFLGEAIDVAGPWSLDTLKAHFLGLPAEAAAASSPALDAIRRSADCEHAALTFIIQFAGDFLSEASAMARNVLGNHGPSQSELFKIVIDEFGYGVHETKHSTVFERLMTSVGLHPKPHAYWQFYLTSSLMTNNYFHYLCRNHAHFFRYLGALYYTEASLPYICKRVAHCLSEVFAGRIDVTYFAEHMHIDQHHGRMAFDKLVVPVVQRFGTGVIADIVRGFEEFKLLSDIADQDFIDQVAWSDGGEAYKALAAPVHDRIASGRIAPKRQRFVEPRGELSVTHVHDGDELCWIDSGTMRFVTGHGRSVLLHAGQGTVIRRNRLHGAIIESDECIYDIHSIGDYEACLS